MITVVIANVLALLLTAFVAGVLIGVLVHPPFRRAVTKLATRVWEKRPELLFKRASCNPILTPRTNYWEAEAVMNPAALYLGDRVHLVYRAIGADGVSRLGYASSPDGLVFDDRLSYPVYVARSPGGVVESRRRYSPVMYPSGGSWGGCEDPRMVTIDENVYVTFNMFDNWTLRIGLVYMPVEDFLAKRFMSWRGPFILSNGAREKNWMLFPEKINGKFAVLHGIIDQDENRVRIEYTDDLTTLSQRKFETVDPQTVPDKQIAWHTHIRSAGPPPLKTPAGWLVLYHAHDAEEPNRYKMGAMLLDLNNPERITHRAPHPVLEPDALYENDGKPGVIYADGAIIKDGTLYVYYGGADKIVATASAPLDAFLDALTNDQAPSLEAERLQVPA